MFNFNFVFIYNIISIILFVRSKNYYGYGNFIFIKSYKIGGLSYYTKRVIDLEIQIILRQDVYVQFVNEFLLKLDYF